MTLRLVHSRAHDLPPSWDGLRVDWSPWEVSGHSSLVFHAPADQFACTGCGWIPETELRAIGRVHAEPGATFSVYPHVRARRKANVPAWPIARLVASRCTGCGLDQVTDVETGEVWDLDESDYTDAGSWPEVDTLF